jgi:hypothetical protein
MSASAAGIVAHLRVVDAERQRRTELPGLLARVTELKAFQQRRFSHTYSDLLASARYGAAARYFLAELYGPGDFTTRDAQFARVAPAMARLFPDQVAETVAILAELHALSETLDTETAMHLPDGAVAPLDYVRAWQATGRAPDREHQIELTLRIAAQLDRITRLPMLRSALRLMRAPARAAGLAQVQRSLETGFDVFRAMKGAQEFIAVIDSRERALAAALFAAHPSGRGDDSSMDRALAGLAPTPADLG